MNPRPKVRPLRRRRIGMLGKGGAGRSTISILLAKVLRDAGYPICVQDADSAHLGTEHLPDEAPAKQARSYFRHASPWRIFVLLNKMGDGETGRLLQDRLRALRLPPVATRREEATVRSAWLRGEPVQLRAPQSLVELVEAMEQVVAPASITNGNGAPNEVGWP